MNQVLPIEPSPVAPSTINRRLAAIAFADIAGFSRFMALDDIETAAPLEASCEPKSWNRTLPGTVDAWLRSPEMPCLRNFPAS